MRRLLRSTTAACTGVTMLLATSALAQTLPSAGLVAGLKDRQCVRILTMLAEDDDSPRQVKEAAEAQNGPAGACDTLSGVWSMVEPNMLSEDNIRLLAAAMRQAGVEIDAAALLAASDETAATTAPEAPAETPPPIQSLPSSDQVAGLEDRQCIRLLRMLGEDADAAQSVANAAASANGPAGSCDTLSGVWDDVEPNMFDDESASLLKAALRQAPAALSGDAEAAETTTETVTEDTARSSDEDFAPAASGGGGMSDLEKALLVGAGALVAGAIISNNREVVNSTPDRVVVESDNGDLQVLKDDNALLRQPGSEVSTESYSDGSSRTVVTRPDGSQIVTIRDAELRVVRRTVTDANGRQTVLIDDTAATDPVDVTALPDPAPEVAAVDTSDADALRAALRAQNVTGRRFSLAQVRDIDRVRKLAPAISVDNITFETGSAAIRPSEAEELAVIGRVIADAIAADPGEVFLVEGHTDAVGSAGMNLLLSDRRAESVALALTEYFDVPPENLVVQGYGESDLRIQTDQAERANRRAVVRRVTPLLRN